MGSLSPWHLLILVAVLVLLFGAKKLPDAARSVGRSLKILKAETKDLHGDGNDDEQREDQQPAAKALPSSTATAAAANGVAPSSEDKVAELQRQLDELKQQKNAG